MKNIITISGIRPDFIRMSEIFKKLDANFNHTLIHSGQHFDGRNLAFNRLCDGSHRPEDRIQPRRYGPKLQILFWQERAARVRARQNCPVVRRECNARRQLHLFRLGQKVAAD